MYYLISLRVLWSVFFFFFGSFFTFVLIHFFLIEVCPFLLRLRSLKVDWQLFVMGIIIG